MSEDTDGSPDVAVVVPHTGTVSMRWAIRFATLNLPAYRVVARRPAAVDLARERGVEEALTSDPEWLLLLDSDVLPPEDVFARLRRHDRPVVSGLYYVPGEGQLVYPAAWRLDRHGSISPLEVDDEGRVVFDAGDGRRVLDTVGEGLVTVDCVGLGCTLVHRSVFESVDRPWFRWTKGYEDHPWDLRHEGETPGVSEDFFFCYRLAQAGYDVHLDTSVQCAHEKGCLLTGDGALLETHANDR